MTLHFKTEEKRCPVCKAEKIEKQYFSSSEGVLSLPNINHSRCLGCGTVFVNPQPTPESLEAFYNSMESEEVESVLANSLQRYRDPAKRDYFITHRVQPLLTYLSPAASILDIGCGTGVFVRFMVDHGFDAFGIDIHKPSIEYGKKNLNLDDRLSTLIWDDLPDNKQYDMITAWTVLEHLSEPEEFLKTCQKLLKPGGILLTEFPTVDSLLFEKTEDGFFWVMPPYHLFLFSKKGAETLLKKADFTPLTYRNMPNNWYFSASLARKLDVDINSALQQTPELQKLFSHIDRVFDEVALESSKSSTIYFISQKAS